MHTIQALHAFMDQHSTQAPHAQIMMMMMMMVMMILAVQTDEFEG